MPLHDYLCSCCGFVEADVYRSVEEGASRALPTCPDCGLPMTWVPQARFDLKTDGEGDRGFQKFTVHRQGPRGVEAVEIDSLHKLRQVEKDSEQRYRDGEGEPLRVRGYSQDRSNMDQSSFGTAGQIGERTYDSGATPQKEKNIGVKRHGGGEPAIPTARIGGVSPLKE